MSKHDFGYFFHEGLSNMFSHGFMSFAAIGITVACLLIMGTFTLVAVNADANLKQAEQDNEILAFVDDSYTEAQAKALQKKLEAVDNVASVTFISREEAMQSFISEHPDEEYFQDLDPNILRDRFAIKVKELKLQSQTVELIKAIPGIGGINAYAELTNGFITVRNIATVICLTLIAVLFVVSMFIISNTIKLTTFDRRDEIAIMKMVGATNGLQKKKEQADKLKESGKTDRRRQEEEKEDVMARSKNLLDQRNQLLLEQIDDTQSQIQHAADEITRYEELEDLQYELFCEQVPARRNAAV